MTIQPIFTEHQIYTALEFEKVRQCISHSIVLDAPLRNTLHRKYLFVTVFHLAFGPPGPRPGQEGGPTIPGETFPALSFSPPFLPSRAASHDGLRTTLPLLRPVPAALRTRPYMNSYSDALFGRPRSPRWFDSMRMRRRLGRALAQISHREG